MPIELAKARKWAEQIVEELKPFCERIEIAGSIRRQRPQVNDIDFVILPKDGNVEAVKARCMRNSPQVLTNGTVNFLFMIGHNVQVDIFFARAPAHELFGRTPGNWGSLLVCRTGSATFNAWLASQAKRAGLHWNPYSGVDRNGTALPCEEEADVFKAIGVDWVKPEQREK